NNTYFGALVSDRFSTANVFAGNVIADNNYGIQIRDADNNRVGQTAATLGNRIANNKVGLSIFQRAFGPTGAAKQNVVENNQITANKIGVYISGADQNTVGGSTAASANMINANVEGVVIEDRRASDNRVEGNFIGLNPNGTAKDSRGMPTGN